MTARSPANAIAITPRAWDVRREKNISIEPHLLAIMSKIETQTRRGCTDEGIFEVIERIVGPANTKLMRLDNLPKKGAFKGTLFIECDHACTAFDLRRFLPALRAALRPLKIQDVRMR
jgi:hypothetical protein